MVVTGFLVGLVTFFGLLALLSFGFSLYTFIRVRAWEKTEYKVLPVSDPQTSGFEKLNESLMKLSEQNAEALREAGGNFDNLV